MEQDHLGFKISVGVLLFLIAATIGELTGVLQETNIILKYHFECEEVKNELDKDK